MTIESPGRTAEDLLFHMSGMAFPAAWVEALCGFDHPTIEALPLKLPVLKQRDADFAVIVRSPGPAHVVHIEYWSARASLPRTALYHMWYYEHTGLPVRTIIVTTSERLRHAVPSEISFRVGQHPATRVPLGVVHLWDLDAEEVLRRRRVSLYPFVPLMRRRCGARVLLARLLERIIEDVRPARVQENVRAGACILALKRFSRRTVKRVFGGIEDMARTDIGRELIGIGEKRGVAKGIAESILSALDARFGRVHADVRRRVRAIDDESTLRTLLRLAVTAKSVAAFEARIPQA